VVFIFWGVNLKIQAVFRLLQLQIFNAFDKGLSGMDGVDVNAREKPKGG
jgi:hypothetical protein